jgi:hypothetical protein
MTDTIKKDILDTIPEVMSIAELAIRFGVSRQAMHQALTRHGLMQVWKRRAKKKDVRQALLARMSRAGQAGTGASKARKRKSPA